MTHISDQFSLENKVAIITGSSKGIGKAIAKGLAQKGAQVVISSRSQEACDEVVKEFEKDGLKAIGIACHIGKEDQRKNLVNKTIETFGQIDVLVNNAAINPVFGPIEEVDPDIFDKIMDTVTDQFRKYPTVQSRNRLYNCSIQSLIEFKNKSIRFLKWVI